MACHIDLFVLFPEMFSLGRFFCTHKNKSNTCIWGQYLVIIILELTGQAGHISTLAVLIFIVKDMIAFI